MNRDFYSSLAHPQFLTQIPIAGQFTFSRQITFQALELFGFSRTCSLRPDAIQRPIQDFESPLTFKELVGSFPGLSVGMLQRKDSEASAALQGPGGIAFVRKEVLERDQ